MPTDPAAVELRHMRYFLAVMEELHFGRAADRLHMAQPPLSRAIRKLEDNLGVQLLVRSSRAVTPTAAGRVFADEARKVLASVDQAVAEARHAGGASTVLRIGCMLHLQPGRLHAFLDALAARAPDVTTEVTHLAALEQVRRLRGGELDVAIFLDVGDAPDIATEPMFRGEKLAAFVAESHPLAARDVVSSEDLADETLIIFPRSANPALHDRTRARFAEAGYRFRDVLEATSINARDALVLTAQGRGVYLGFDHFRHDVAAEGARVVGRPLAPGLSAPDVRLAWSTRTPEAASTRLSLVCDVARELYAAHVAPT